MTKENRPTIATVEQPDKLDVMLTNPCCDILLELELGQVASK